MASHDDPLTVTDVSDFASLFAALPTPYEVMTPEPGPIGKGPVCWSLRLYSTAMVILCC